MKVFSYILALLVFMFSLTSYADSSKNIIEQVGNVNVGNWQIINKQYLTYNKKVRVVVCVFDSTVVSKQKCNVQVIFTHLKDGIYKLESIQYSSLDRVLSNMKLVVEN